MQLFAGMIQQPALSAENLAADVPIVLAERRERAGPDLRVALALHELLYSGQRLAGRAPIGTVETLEAATPEAVRDTLERLQANGAARYPFLSLALVPARDVTCPPALRSNESARELARFAPRH